MSSRKNEAPMAFPGTTLTLTAFSFLKVSRSSTFPPKSDPYNTHSARGGPSFSFMVKDYSGRSDRRQKTFSFYGLQGQALQGILRLFEPLNFHSQCLFTT